MLQDSIGQIFGSQTHDARRAIGQAGAGRDHNAHPKGPSFEDVLTTTSNSDGDADTASPSVIEDADSPSAEPVDADLVDPGNVDLDGSISDTEQADGDGEVFADTDADPSYFTAPRVASDSDDPAETMAEDADPAQAAIDTRPAQPVTPRMSEESRDQAPLASDAVLDRDQAVEAATVQPSGRSQGANRVGTNTQTPITSVPLAIDNDSPAPDVASTAIMHTGREAVGGVAPDRAAPSGPHLSAPASEPRAAIDVAQRANAPSSLSTWAVQSDLASGPTKVRADVTVRSTDRVIVQPAIDARPMPTTPVMSLPAGPSPIDATTPIPVPTIGTREAPQVATPQIRTADGPQIVADRGTVPPAVGEPIRAEAVTTTQTEIRVPMVPPQRPIPTADVAPAPSATGGERRDGRSEPEAVVRPINRPSPPQNAATPMITAAPVTTAFETREVLARHSFTLDSDISPELRGPSDAPSQLRSLPDGTIARSELPRHISAQMAEAMQRGGSRPVELHLNPIELGRVKMSVQTVDGAVIVHVAADRPETLELMRRHVDLLANDFRAIGYGTAEFSFAQQGSDKGDGAFDGASGASVEAERTGPPPSEDTEIAAPALHISDRVDIRI